MIVRVTPMSRASSTRFRMTSPFYGSYSSTVSSLTGSGHYRTAWCSWHGRGVRSRVGGADRVRPPYSTLCSEFRVAPATLINIGAHP